MVKAFAQIMPHADNRARIARFLKLGQQQTFNSVRVEHA
jgi:hypothetical protein